MTAILPVGGTVFPSRTATRLPRALSIFPGTFTSGGSTSSDHHIIVSSSSSSTFVLNNDPLGSHLTRPGLAFPGQIRTVIKHPTRVILGHKMEITKKATTKKRPPQVPKYPVHPAEADSKNIKLLTTYADLRLRWTYGTRWSKTWRIARKWCPLRNDYPKPKPTSAFLWHKRMPVKDKDAYTEVPTVSPDALNTKDLFCRDDGEDLFVRCYFL